MIQDHMDVLIKAFMLERQGLTYLQYGRLNNSGHVDLRPLLEALQEYIDAYDAWVDTGDYTAMQAAGIRIGLAQRELPVHVVNEYCRLDRSFYPLPTFDDDTLPRKVACFHYASSMFIPFYPLEITDSSGLGVDYVLVQGGLSPTLTSNIAYIATMARIDLAAIRQLDAVNTERLRRLRANLGAADLNTLARTAL